MLCDGTYPGGWGKEWDPGKAGLSALIFAGGRTITPGERGASAPCFSERQNQRADAPRSPTREEGIVAKQGERDYFRNIGEEGIRHAIRKPFYDADCWRYLLEIGAMMSMLPPPPPVRLLDLGCGTGWTSIFFAKRG